MSSRPPPASSSRRPSPADAAPPDVEAIEASLLLDGVLARYGYDFRGYQRDMVLRRLAAFRAIHGLATTSDVTRRVLREPDLFDGLVASFSVRVTELFRDPPFYAALREKVLPMLRTWPHVKVWDAGCASGEEVYSVAIFLAEAGLHERSTIYATDIDAAALEIARAGVYPLDVVRRGSRGYLAAGGAASLSEYYAAGYDAAVLDGRLRDRVTFATHNLAMDASFGEMQLVVCRNVLIYFDAALQDAVLEMFADSLEHGGFLCLGEDESLQFTSVAARFDVVDAAARIYKKRSSR